MKNKHLIFYSLMILISGVAIFILIGNSKGEIGVSPGNNESEKFLLESSKKDAEIQQLQNDIIALKTEIKQTKQANTALQQENSRLVLNNSYLKGEIEFMSWNYYLHKYSFNYNSDLSYTMKSVNNKEVCIEFNRDVWLVGRDASPNQRMSCLTESMFPLFDCYDTIIAYKPLNTEIKEGDIISFKASTDPKYNPYGYTWFIHRVNWREGDWIGTMGINNQGEDYPTHISNVTGKIWR